MKQVNLKTNYSCPDCNAYLRVWKNIIFTIRSADGKKNGLLLLNPDPGNYSVTTHPSMSFEKGEKIDFLCPVCHSNLAASDINENLVHIDMQGEDVDTFDVYFSRVFGEETTFMVSDNHIASKYGKDEAYYLNYFEEKFKK